MMTNHVERLQKETGLFQHELTNALDLQNDDEKTISLAFAELDAIIETHVLREIDSFLAKTQKDFVLIRFISEDDFALYEPELFNLLKCCPIHKAFISRAKRAIERIGGEVAIAYMDSNYYEKWLEINDFDDNPDLRQAWAIQQIKGL